MELVQEYGDIMFAAIGLIFVVLLISMLVMGAKLRKIRKSYNAMMQSSGVDNLESIIINLRAGLEQQQQTITGLTERLGKIESHLPTMKSNVTIHRYNAFYDTGSDLSFSVAILNEAQDGVVLTSIHSREGGYLYGKPVEKGESKYSLTPEEKKVIAEAK